MAEADAAPTPPSIDGHAPFAPSAASVWLECPYSVQLAVDLHRSGRLPLKPRGVRALLGTLIHEYAEQAILRAFHPSGQAYTAWLLQCRPMVEEFLRSVKPNAHENAVQAWTTAVLTAVEVWVRAAGMFAERIPPAVRVICPEYRVCVVPNWLYGTADLVIASLSPSCPRLIVLDLKTGRAPVEVEDNPQLLLYAAGAVEALREFGAAVEPTWELTLGVVQPTRTVNEAIPPGRPLRYTQAYDTTVAAALRLAERARQLAAAAAARACTPTPGGHCRFCRVHDACPGYTRSVLDVFRQADLVHGLRSPAHADGVLPSASHEPP